MTASCTSFLGLGAAVATFELSPSLAQEDSDLTGRLSQVSEWFQHETMTDFAAERSHESVGIAATLLDGKDCLRRLTPDAEDILFERNPAAYYASANEQVVIVLFAERQGSGVIFVQSP